MITNFYQICENWSQKNLQKMITCPDIKNNLQINKEPGLY
jgi:hypothetical protein